MERKRNASWTKARLTHVTGETAAPHPVVGVGA
jgi:hypothetical protein